MITTPPASDGPSPDDPSVREPASVRLREGRLRSTASQRRWAAMVCASGALVAALAAAGLPDVAAVGVGLAWATAAIADLTTRLVSRRFLKANRGLAKHREETERLLFDKLVDGPTHGWFADAHEALLATESRWAGLDSVTADDRAAIDDALSDIRAIEAGLLDSRGRRSTWSGRVSGSYAGAAVFEDPGVLMRLYSDPANLPDRLGPRGRDVLVRIGAVLDDVRVLNTPQTEWAVLLFTLWARALIVGGASLLATTSFGHPPVDGGWGAQDLPWAVAVVWSAATALCAPRIATTVMRHDDTGATLRRRLLAVEVPLAVVAIACSPCWPVAAFAVGWSNWWQRPDFTFGRLATWIAVTGGLLVTAMALRGADVGAAGAEFAVTMTVSAIIGASYGAMLPVSATLLLRTVVGGLAVPRRARDRADARIHDAIRHLRQAARAIERSTPGDALAARDVREIRMSADMLGARANEDAAERWARRTPLGIANLMDGALRHAGVMADEPRAELLSEEAQLAGEPEPLLLDEASFHDRRLKRARIRKRRVARALRLLVTEIVREARRHGTGPFVTMCRLDADRVVLRFANAVRPGPPRRGRGNGVGNLSRLAAALPDGRVDTREVVAGSFIDLPDRARRFGVQVSFSTAALHAPEDDPS